MYNNLIIHLIYKIDPLHNGKKSSLFLFRFGYLIEGILHHLCILAHENIYKIIDILKFLYIEMHRIYKKNNI